MAYQGSQWDIRVFTAYKDFQSRGSVLGNLYQDCFKWEKARELGLSVFANGPTNGPPK